MAINSSKTFVMSAKAAGRPIKRLSETDWMKKGNTKSDSVLCFPLSNYSHNKRCCLKVSHHQDMVKHILADFLVCLNDECSSLKLKQ